MIANPPTLPDADVELATAAARCVVRTHQRLVNFIKVGHTLAHIDAEVARILADLKCRSCFQGYKVGKCPPFPSHACLSVNHCVVHGTAGYYTQPLAKGDVLKVDIGVFHQGFVGDAAWTYVLGDYPSDTVKRLCTAGRESLRLGCQQLRPGNKWIEWARTVQRVVEHDFGFHLIRGLGGHGYGRKLHAPPFVSNTVPKLLGEWPEATLACQPGTLVAVEPMIAVGTGATFQAPRTWPVFSADGSLAVHHEHDVLITKDGPLVLTQELENQPDLVG